MSLRGACVCRLWDLASGAELARGNGSVGMRSLPAWATRGFVTTRRCHGWKAPSLSVEAWQGAPVAMQLQGDGPHLVGIYNGNPSTSAAPAADDPAQLRGLLALYPAHGISSSECVVALRDGSGCLAVTAHGRLLRYALSG